jgi:hypothetical protein
VVKQVLLPWFNAYQFLALAVNRLACQKVEVLVKN